ncbi:MAG TPA: hypothetical protein VIL01_15260 [Thermomicrobiales bacterium]
MSRSLRSIILLAIVICSLAASSGGRGAAQAEPPAADFLPAATVFGTEWVMLGTMALELPADAFQDGVSSVYGGPAGARVIILVMREASERVVVRRSWEEALTLLERAGREMVRDRDQNEILAALPPPPGCQEAKRLEGTARALGLDTGIPVGVTLCATGSGTLLLVTTTGTVLDLTGHEASDAVTALLLGAGPLATPSAG